MRSSYYILAGCLLVSNLVYAVCPSEYEYLRKLPSWESNQATDFITEPLKNSFRSEPKMRHEMFCLLTARTKELSGTNVTRLVSDILPDAFKTSDEDLKADIRDLFKNRVKKLSDTNISYLVDLRENGNVGPDLHAFINDLLRGKAINSTRKDAPGTGSAQH